jgi:hypothetical protein
MRKLVMSAAAAAVAIPAQVTVITPAYAGYNNIPSFCKNYVASGTDAALNQGECVSLLTQQFHYYVDGKNANTYAVHACDYYAENYPDLFDSLWDSKQQCVAEILS